MKDNPLSQITKENPTFFQHKKTNLFDISADSAYFADENGKAVDFKMAHDLYDEHTSWNEDAKNIWRQNLPCTLSSYSDFMWHKLELRMNELNDSETVRKQKKAVMRQLLKQETSESGCHVMDLCNLKEYGSYSRLTGDYTKYSAKFKFGHKLLI
jgi:hypothetical protein